VSRARPLVVAALGGNALLRRGEPMTLEIQRRNIAGAASALGRLARVCDLVVTHGDGPQVGLLALRSEAAEGDPDPLDLLGAEAEGMIGYLLDQALGNQLDGREVATLLTQVVVAADDPALRNPAKPIGPFYGADQASALASDRGWSVTQQGDGWRRVVASPEPLDIIELPIIRRLVDDGVLVVCVGGGGVPVRVDQLGCLHGVDAVVDKDLASALLAERLGADALLLLTDVDLVELDHGTPDARPVHELRAEALDLEAFEAGSMRPKLIAASRFARTGGLAVIGALDDAASMVDGNAGTRIVAVPIVA
jgi:carbamate kinase